MQSLTAATGMFTVSQLQQGLLVCNLRLTATARGNRNNYMLMSNAGRIIATAEIQASITSVSGI